MEPSLAGVEQTWVSPQVDGDVYAEPLVFGGDVVAATENNSVYALDASTGDVRWQTNLGAPVDSSTLPCGNIDPISGITATPVIDPSSNLIYAVAFLAPGHHELFAIHAESGEVAWHRPIDPPGMDPLTQQLRSALALANGRVYAAFGGLFGDCGQYHGWVAGLAADGSGSLIDYRAPTVNAGGIWAPSGPAVDEDGNLYVATGNSFSNTEFDLGDSVIKLSPTLEQLDFFAPKDWADLNAGDVDLGSVGPAVLPDGRIFQIGKGGTGYLLDGRPPRRDRRRALVGRRVRGLVRRHRPHRRQHLRPLYGRIGCSFAVRGRRVRGAVAVGHLRRRASDRGRRSGVDRRCLRGRSARLRPGEWGRGRPA